ncbi:carboxylate-amine ligase [Kitasatospora camelliae]|uniref:Putative glutamate--cysteine ligase 2 n=1 Tax=Kitasatospora camelliae TaxID=3156397 RepID=A0AAU8JZ75_9ACTN
MTAIGELPTLGVEEEFLLVDAVTRAPAGAAPLVVKHAQESLGDQVGGELFPSMIETRSVPASALADLRADLARVRTGVTAVAGEIGCRVAASGTSVVPESGLLEVSDHSRYRRLAAEYGPLVTGDQGAGVCGCHIHLGVPDRERAVRLGGHLRPWLPVLQAVAANSPFHAGRDTGHASWRSLRWAQWPGAGPMPRFTDAAAYEATVDALVGSGMLLDRRMVYWYARPSESYPTLEVRVADTNADLDGVILLAGLLRGLAAVLLAEDRDGVPVPEVPDPLLLAAHWRAARDGLGGLGFDPVAGRTVPAVDLVEALIERAGPGLAAAGDLTAVRELWRGVRARGGGADRQREAFRVRGDLRDVVDAVAVVR